MLFSRIFVAISLFIIIVLSVYTEYTNLLFLLIHIAIAYDSVYMYRNLNVNPIIVIIFNTIICIFNVSLEKTYDEEPIRVIVIVTIAQVNDICQYLTGVHFGKHKIGWISKNKTYEGYILGLFLTVICLFPFFNLCETIIPAFKLNDKLWYTALVSIAGCSGSLCSSLFKRAIEIKDYSDLLGPHGGWLDRMDSIIFPIILSWFDRKI